MKLSIKERILVSELFPKESNILTQTIIKEVAKKVEITKDEQEAIGMKSTPAGYQWSADKAKDSDKDVEFSKIELSILKEQVNALDAQKKVTQELLSLCIKIKEASIE